MLSQSIDLKRRTGDIRCVILHSPSVTFSKRVGGTIAGALKRYEYTQAKFYGHAIIDSLGVKADLAPLHLRAQHTASLSNLYLSGSWGQYAHPYGQASTKRHYRDPKVVFDWFFDRYPSVDTPYDLVRTRYPNNISVGLDLMPTVDGVFTVDQLKAAAEYCVSVLAEQGLVATMVGDSPNVFTHSDVDPIRRGTVKGKNKTIVGKAWDLNSGFDRSVFESFMGKGSCE